MSLTILQVVESQSYDAGSAFISVSGLARYLSAVDVQVGIASSDRGTAGTEMSTNALPEAVVRADVIHIHGWAHAAAHRAAELAYAHGKPFVVSPIGAFSERSAARPGRLKRWRLGRRDRRLLRACFRLLPINQHESRDCRNRWPDLAMETLPYGLDMGAYASVDEADRGTAESDPRLMLILAPLHPVEGCVALLKSLADVGRVADDWAILLAGRTVGRYRGKFEAALRRKGVHDRVRFEAAPDEAAQRTLLARADVVVSPAMRVRCPVSVLQGLASGVPILASHCVAPDEPTDWLSTCPPTREGFREAVAALVTVTDAQRHEAGVRARAWAAERFDWATLGPRYVALYRELVCG